MVGWAEFVFAFMVFFLSHSVPVRPPVRPWLVALLGQRGFTFGYSLLSIGVFVWLIRATRTAPHVQIWPWAPWQAYVPLAGMLAVCCILCLSLGRPNPFSFGGTGNDRFDARRPGLARLTRHPILLALALWAVTHVVPNGDVAHVTLFSVFAGFALLGARLVDARKRQALGQAWEDLRAEMASVSLVDALRDVVTMPRLIAAVVLWGGLIALHPLVLGVSPLP